MRKPVLCGLTTILTALAMGAGVGLSETLPEAEPNDPIGEPQALSFSSDTVTVQGVLGAIGARLDDVDFYSFFARAGDVVTVDIDDGMGGVQPVEAFLAIFRPVPVPADASGSGTPPFEIVKDSKDTRDGNDPRIENHLIEEDGVYVIGVSNYPRTFNPDGTVTYAYAIRNGDYTLSVSGVTPSTLQVPIRIRPGSRDLRVLDPRARGKIPVAILSFNTFHPMDVDPSSLRFGATGQEESLAYCGRWGKNGNPGGDVRGPDLNRDGIPDLMCHFRNQDAGFEIGDSEGVLRGRTYTGVSFEARGRLKVVPQRRVRGPTQAALPEERKRHR